MALTRTRRLDTTRKIQNPTLKACALGSKSFPQRICKVNSSACIVRTGDVSPPGGEVRVGIVKSPCGLGWLPGGIRLAVVSGPEVQSWEWY